MTRNAIHTVYRDKEGNRLCGVTTYLNILSKPALISWAWNLGVEGLDYKKVRDSAGGTGTIVHYLILCQLKGIEPDLSEYSPQEIASTEVPMSKWEHWKKENEIEPIILEVPMVSLEHKFGGTPDFYGKVNGINTLLDFKTGKQVYQEAFYQVAAYKVMLEEDRGLMLVDGEWVEHAPYPVEAVKILRMGKSEDEGFDEQAAGNLDKHWEIFLHCQSIYELQGAIRRNAKGFEE